MDNKYRKEIANRMLTRALTGLYFLEDFLCRHSAKDGADFRSLCILLSYSFELTLKTAVVMTSESVIKDELEGELKDLNHDIIKISRSFEKDDLNKIGIKSITSRNTNSFVGYIAKTCDDKEIVIENFIDIRYDFMNDSLRGLPENEEFKTWVTETIGIANKIKKQVHERPSVL
jgi:hypothetical protein